MNQMFKRICNLGQTEVVTDVFEIVHYFIFFIIV